MGVAHGAVFFQQIDPGSFYIIRENNVCTNLVVQLYNKIRLDDVQYYYVVECIFLLPNK